MDINKAKEDFLTYQHAAWQTKDLLPAITNLTEQQPFKDLFQILSKEGCRIPFLYLGRRFDIQLELYYDNSKPVVTLATYFDPEVKLAPTSLLFSMPVPETYFREGYRDANEVAMAYIEAFTDSANKTILTKTYPAILHRTT